MPKNWSKAKISIWFWSAKAIPGYKGLRDIDTPSWFLKCGYCFSNLFEYLRCTAIKTNDRYAIEELRNFTERYKSNEWQVFATNAKATYESKKANKPEELPLEEDTNVQRLRSSKNQCDFTEMWKETADCFWLETIGRLYSCQDDNFQRPQRRRMLEIDIRSLEKRRRWEMEEQLSLKRFGWHREEACREDATVYVCCRRIFLKRLKYPSEENQNDQHFK